MSPTLDVSPLRVDTLTDVAHGVDVVDRIAEDWDALADRAGAGPFVRAGWIAAWWQAFGKGTLELLTATRDGSLHAVLPLVRHRLSRESPTNWHSPRFGIVADEVCARRAVLEALFSQPSHLVSLNFIRKGDPDIAALTAAAEDTGRRVHVRTVERACAVEIQDEWSSYERTLPGGLRRDIGRRKRRLAELGPVTLEVIERTPELEQRLPEAFALENLGWKAERKTAIVSRAQTARFYTQIALWAAERGWLRLIFLRLGVRPLAFHLAIEHAGTYYPLKGGFDPAFGVYSPGQLIIRETLERAFAAGLDRYEFLGDAAEYKRRWATQTSDRVLFQAFAPTLPGRVGRGAFVYGRPVAKRLAGTLWR